MPRHEGRLLRNRPVDPVVTPTRPTDDRVERLPPLWIAVLLMTPKRFRVFAQQRAGTKLVGVHQLLDMGR